MLGLRRRSALVVSIVSWLIEQVLGFPPWLALVLIFLLPAAEASVFAGFIFPGEVVVFFGGVLANEGRLALWTVILVGSLGAIIGDSIGYEVGRHYGMRLLARLPARLVKPDHVTRAQDLIRRKGGRAIFLGRFTAALRVLVPGLAGTSGMPYRRFLLFNVTGGITWVVETTLVGYVAGKSYRAAERRLSLISLGLLAAVVVFVAVKLARRSDRTRTILARIDLTRALGRPLSAVLVTLLGAGWLFGGVAEDVTVTEGIALADPGWLHDLVGLRTPWLTDVARAVTDLGQGVLLYPALAVAGLLALRRLGQRRWLVAGCSSAVSPSRSPGAVPVPCPRPQVPTGHVHCETHKHPRQRRNRRRSPGCRPGRGQNGIDFTGMFLALSGGRRSPRSQRVHQPSK